MKKNIDLCTSIENLHLMTQFQLDDIVITLNRRNVKRLRLMVYPDGRVMVVAPMSMAEREVYQFIEHHAEWIRKHYSAMITKEHRRANQFITGEQHWLFGRQLPLRVEYVTSRSQGAILVNDTIVIYCRRDAISGKLQALLNELYVNLLSKYVRQRLDYYLPLYSENQVSFRIRFAKTKWGSCAARKRNLMFNLVLAQCPEYLIDYVIVHELCHLQIQNHSTDFWRLVEERMPDYKERKKQLNALALNLF